MTKPSLKDTFKKRVKAGMAYLDVIYPDWVEHIDLKKLDLGRSNTCMIGELYGEYSASRVGLNELTKVKIQGNGYIDVPEAFGFYIEGDHNSRIVMSHYKLLTDIWKKEIKKLRRK